MSAHVVIDNYLNEDIPNTVTMESLTIYLQEGIGVKPFISLLGFIKQLTNINSIQDLFSKRKSIVVSNLNNTVKSLSEDVYGKKDNPFDITHKPAPDDKKSADAFLVRLYKYFKDKINGLKLPDLRTIFDAAYSIIVKSFIAAGFIGLSWLTGGLFIPFALIIVLLCVLNANDQTKDIEDVDHRIDLKKAFKNVMNGFKRIFTSLKNDKGQAKFAFISLFIAKALSWLKSEAAIERVENIFGAISNRVVDLTSPVANFVWTIVKNKVGLNDTEKELLKNSIETASKNQGAIDAVETGSGKFASYIEKLHQHSKGSDPAITQAYANASEKVIGAAAKDVVQKGASAINKDEVKVVISKLTRTVAQLVRKYVIPAMLIAIVLYLFAEIVDHFNLKKIKEREDEREEFERTI